MPGAVEIHWRRLRLSLAAFVAASLAGVAAAAAAWWHEHHILEGMEAAEVRLAEARERYTALAGEREERRRFAPRYRWLAARGRLGEEQPARWTEAARSAGIEVAAARHRLGSTHLVENIGPVEVRATDLSIEIEMRHEAELTRFLAALEREAPGMFTVSGCRLVRTDGSGAEEPSPAAVPGATVGAACRIRWQSVVLSGVEPGWTPRLRSGRREGRGGNGSRSGGGACRAASGDLRPPVHDRGGTRADRRGPRGPERGNSGERNPGRIPRSLRTRPRAGLAGCTSAESSPAPAVRCLPGSTAGESRTATRFRSAPAQPSLGRPEFASTREAICS